MGLGGVIHIFRSAFRQEHENDPRRVFEWSKSDTIWKYENSEILVNSVKSGIFRHSKWQDWAVFQDVNLKFCTHIIQTCYFSYILFLNSQFNFKILEKKSPNFNFFNHFKTRHDSLIAVFNLHVLFKINWFYH